MTTVTAIALSAYHATDERVVEAILRDGFRLDVNRRSDPGDFGRAIYFTTEIARARAIGKTILKVELDLHTALVLHETDAYAYVIDQLGFDTIHGHGNREQRLVEAEKARKYLLTLGYDALVSYRGRWDLEIAVYDLSRIRKIEVFERR